MKASFVKILLLGLVILTIFDSLLSKSLRRRRHKQHKNKQNFTYSGNQPTYQNDSSPQVIYTNEGPQTPLTTGDFSRGGQMYHTDASTIPYGTGYSYGKWQKIKFD